MGRTKKTEKQTVFGLRTDHMSEEVYNHLEQKARSKKLATYIIQLVEQDLTQKEPFDDKKRTSKSLKKPRTNDERYKTYYTNHFRSPGGSCICCSYAKR